MRSVYIFVLGVFINFNESVYGMALYALLLEFSCANFDGVLAISSFILAVIFLAFLSLHLFFALEKLSNDSLSKKWTAEHLSPLLVGERGD